MKLSKSLSCSLIMTGIWQWFIICFRLRSQSCHMPGKERSQVTGLASGRARTLEQASARALGTPTCPAATITSPGPATPSDTFIPWFCCGPLGPFCSLFVSLCLSHASAQVCACVTCVCMCVHGPIPLLTGEMKSKEHEMSNNE